MITLMFIWGALVGTFRFICWLFGGMIKLMFKATVILTVTVWTFIIVVIGWIVKEIISFILRKAGVDTSGWKSPVTLDQIDAALDRWNRRLDYKFRRSRYTYKRRPSTDISLREMILYDIITDD